MRWICLSAVFLLLVFVCAKHAGEQTPIDTDKDRTIKPTNQEPATSEAGQQNNEIKISKLLLQKRNRLMLSDSDDNVYEGTCNLWKTYDSDKYHEITVYSKYILVQLLKNGNIHNFCVFSRTDEDLLDKYFANEEPLYVSFFTEWIIGIYRHYLFTDIGTGPFVRGLRIIDLSTGKLIYEGSWNEKEFQFDDDYHVRVFKYFEEHSPNAENPDNLVDYVLHEYVLDLTTGELKDLERSEVFVGN